MVATDITPLTQLFTLAKHMPDKLTQSEKSLLADIYYESLEQLNDPESLLAYTLAKPMHRQQTGQQSGEHIYLQRFEIPQIRLFELLIQYFPPVTLSQHCANTMLVDALQHHQRPVLMDIGIGTGRQVVDILTKLGQQKNCAIEELTVVGIECFGDALKTAQETIETVAQKLPFPVRFVSKVAFVERLSETDLRALLPNHYDALYANASFALHHIQQVDARKAVFQTLKALSVTGFVLTEPNSDHYEPIYSVRFGNCVNHYGTLFRLIDQLPITDTEKTALKLFFSREIDDILGLPEAVRVEKHFATAQWKALFAETGYVLQKRAIELAFTEQSNTRLQTDLPDRYATVFDNEEVASLFWAA